MGVLEEAVKDPDLRAELGLTDQSQVLIFGCEGATSSGVYEELVGRHPDSIFKDQFQYLNQELRNVSILAIWVMEKIIWVAKQYFEFQFFLVIVKRIPS